MKVLCKELGFIELLCKEQIIIQFIFLNPFFFFFFFLKLKSCIKSYKLDGSIAFCDDLVKTHFSAGRIQMGHGFKATEKNSYNQSKKVVTW